MRSSRGPRAPSLGHVRREHRGPFLLGALLAVLAWSPATPGRCWRPELLAAYTTVSSLAAVGGHPRAALTNVAPRSPPSLTAAGVGLVAVAALT